MQIANISSTNKTYFTGVKEREEFRKNAQEVLEMLQEIEPGTSEYVSSIYDEKTGKSFPSPQDKLHSVLYDVRCVGKEFAQAQDYLLLEACKKAYVEYEEGEDWADAMMGGGGCYIDRSKEAKRFKF